MRAERRTKKKLIVAFHFQFSNQAAWKCDACRASGLERVRRCGWIPNQERKQTGAPVWARGDLAIEECPRSYITGESLAWLEAFAGWKLLGGEGFDRMPARQADAFQVLESAWRAEQKHAND